MTERNIDEPDDTEGSYQRWSDASIKHDVMPVTGKTDKPETDDTEGHRPFAWSDAGIKHDVTPVTGKTDKAETLRRQAGL
jgi:hypothetical protein